jgi:hypothetical protein
MHLRPHRNSHKVARQASSFSASLNHYFIPAREQVKYMLIVTVTAMVVLASILAAQANGMGRLWHLITGTPAYVTYEAWERYPCPTAADPAKTCERRITSTQPSIEFPPPPVVFPTP